jgi:hypothetical protein
VRHTATELVQTSCLTCYLLLCVKILYRDVFHVTTGSHIEMLSSLKFCASGYNLLSCYEIYCVSSHYISFCLDKATLCSPCTYTYTFFLQTDYGNVNIDGQTARKSCRYYNQTRNRITGTMNDRMIQNGHYSLCQIYSFF